MQRCSSLPSWSPLPPAPKELPTITATITPGELFEFHFFDDLQDVQPILAPASDALGLHSDYVATLPPEGEEPAPPLNLRDIAEGVGEPPADGIALRPAPGSRQQPHDLERSTPRAGALGGGYRPLDLALEEAADGSFAPRAPLVDLTLPAQASSEVAFGSGVRLIGITVVGADSASQAEPLDQRAVIWPDALEDTDLVAVPLTFGAELFAQLRSAASPEELTLSLDLPDGATLSADGQGGVAVVDGGDSLAYIHPPSAEDAAGDQVAVEMSAAGDAVILEVAHRGAGVAYPVLVDPEVRDTYTWSAGSFPDARLAEWQAQQSTGLAYELRYTCRPEVPNPGPCYGAASPDRGLYVYGEPSDLFLQNQFGRFSYAVPRIGSTSAFVAQAYFQHVHFHRRGDSNNPTNNSPFLRGAIVNPDASGAAANIALANRPAEQTNDGMTITRPDGNVTGSGLRSGSSPARPARSAPGATSTPAGPRSCSATRSSRRSPSATPTSTPSGSRTSQRPRRSTPPTPGSGSTSSGSCSASGPTAASFTPTRRRSPATAPTRASAPTPPLAPSATRPTT